MPNYDVVDEALIDADLSTVFEIMLDANSYSNRWMPHVEEKIRNGIRRGNIIGAEDHEICNIDNYGDWAEYQYDIRGKEIYFRPLEKWYPVSLENAPEFKLLNKKEIETY